MTEPRDQHDELRELFHDAASDIRPQGSLDDILERTKKVDPMARRWFLPVVAAAAVMTFVIGGAVWIAHDSNNVNGGGPSGTRTLNTEKKDLTIYFGGRTAHGWGLFAETQTLDVSNPLDDAVNAAMHGNPDDGDYQTLWPSTVTTSKKVGFRAKEGDDGGVIPQAIEISLDGSVDRPSGMTERDAVLAIAAVVRSAQAVAPRFAGLPVEFFRENSGAPPTKLDTVFGVTGPFTGGDDLDVMAPVQISSPTNGSKVPAGDLKVSGVAATFEGTVVWEVMVGDAVVKQDHTQAAECCKLAPYSFTVNLEPGTYTIVVHDTDESGGEGGGGVNQDTKEIVVE